MTHHRWRAVRSRSGFTLIELLVVISVVAVLATLLMVTGNLMLTNVKGRSTEQIFAIVRQAVAVAKVEEVPITTSEHPLAGSMGRMNQPRIVDPKPVFYRVSDQWWTYDPSTRVWSDTSNPPYPVPGALTTAGGGIVGPKPGQLLEDSNAFNQRILLDDDVLTEADGGSTGVSNLPRLYGMPRHMLRILGGNMADVTYIQRLPQPDPGITGDPSTGILVGPYHDKLYGYRIYAPGYYVRKNQAAHQLKRKRDPTSGVLDGGTGQMETGGYAEDLRETLDAMLSPSGAQNELASLEALYEPPHDDIYTQPQDFGYYRRVYRSGETSASQPEPDRLSGFVRDPQDGRWFQYRLRGVNLYDGWGNEILCYHDENGGIRFLSAGPDGFFRWNPGEDGRFQTEPWAAAAAGDDRDGSKDNLSQ